MRILIVEDNSLMGNGLQSALNGAGFEVTWAKDGEAALTAMANESFLAMVLDLGLPGISGMEVLQTMRSMGNKTPVMILTGRDSTPEKIASFNQGADDFVAKTTDIEELIARLRALIRRSGRSGKYISGDLELDPDARTATQKGVLLNLSKTEFDILTVLMTNAGQVVTRRQIELALYGHSRQVESNAVEVHIHNLRNKLAGKALRTLRGVGYILGPEA
jgi:DNA-binding response OmpR family regulator